MSFNVENQYQLSQQTSNVPRIRYEEKDYNNDGKRDKAITIFEKNLSTKYIDFDGDGYYDSVIKEGKDGDGKSYRHTTVKETISNIKARPHLDSELYNRKMATIVDVHFGGCFMMGQK